MTDAVEYKLFADLKNIITTILNMATKEKVDLLDNITSSGMTLLRPLRNRY